MWNFSTYLWRDSTLFHIPPIVARFVNCCNPVVFRFLSAWHASDLSKVRKVDGTNYEPEEMKWNLKSLRAMKKTIVTMAALMLMAGAHSHAHSNPRRRDASAATEAAGSRNGVPGYRWTGRNRSPAMRIRLIRLPENQPRRRTRLRVQAQVRATPPPHRKLRLPLSASGIIIS